MAEALRARGRQVVVLISEKQVDAAAAAHYPHLRFVTLPAVAKPATWSPRMLGFGWQTWRSLRRSYKLLDEFQVAAVLGMGGFTSLPPVYAGHRRGLPTFIHDSNARPGRANVLTSRFCSQVLLGQTAAQEYFPKCATLVTGTPARPELNAPPSREQAAANFGLDPHHTTILVTGGSQGARRLNDLCAAAASQLPPTTQILHIAGAADYQRVCEITRNRPGYQVLGFCDQMPAAYAVADLVIARAGASSLTEIALAGQPSILVPYPFAADDHQTRNAEVFAAAGAATLAKEQDLTADKLAGLACAILHDLPTYKRMAQAARALAMPDAAARICAAIETKLPSA